MTNLTGIGIILTSASARTVFLIIQQIHFSHGTKHIVLKNKKNIGTV